MSIPIKYSLLLVLGFLVNINIYADNDFQNIVGILPQGSVNYKCRRFDPPVRIVFFADASNRVDTSHNVVISQYTQMKKRDWGKFVSLWDDYYAVHKKYNLPKPSSSSDISLWDEIMPKNEFYITHEIILGIYTILLVEVRTPSGDLLDRMSSTLKPSKGKFVLTRDLTLQMNPLTRALFFPAFDPMKVSFTALTIGGNIIYSGAQTGSIHVVAVDRDLSDNWVSSFQDTLSTAGGYQIYNVTTGKEYIVKAYMDVNGNEKVDDNEPVGFYYKNPIKSQWNIMDANIQLVDKQKDEPAQSVDREKAGEALKQDSLVDTVGDDVSKEEVDAADKKNLIWWIILGIISLLTILGIGLFLKNKPHRK